MSDYEPMSDAEWLRKELFAARAERDALRADNTELRKFVEDLRMQAVHAESAEVTLASEYIIARIDAMLKGE